MTARDCIILLVLLGAVYILTRMPDFFWHVWRRHELMEYTDEVMSHPFVCPNCGEKFYVKGSRFHIVNGTRRWHLETHGKLRLKCPHCNQVDWCRWTGKDET